MKIARTMITLKRISCSPPPFGEMTAARLYAKTNYSKHNRFYQVDVWFCIDLKFFPDYNSDNEKHKIEPVFGTPAPSLIVFNDWSPHVRRLLRYRSNAIRLSASCAIPIPMRIFSALLIHTTSLLRGKPTNRPILCKSDYTKSPRHFQAGFSTKNSDVAAGACVF